MPPKKWYAYSFCIVLPGAKKKVLCAGGLHALTGARPSQATRERERRRWTRILSISLQTNLKESFKTSLEESFKESWNEKETMLVNTLLCQPCSKWNVTVSYAWKIKTIHKIKWLHTTSSLFMHSSHKIFWNKNHKAEHHLLVKPEENQKTRLDGLRLIVNALYTFEPLLLLPCIYLFYIDIYTIGHG